MAELLSSYSDLLENSTSSEEQDYGIMPLASSGSSSSTCGIDDCSPEIIRTEEECWWEVCFECTTDCTDCGTDCDDCTECGDTTCNYDYGCYTECETDCVDCYDSTTPCSADAAGAYYTYSVTDTSITITIHGLEAGVSKYRFFCYLVNDDGTQTDVVPSAYYGTKDATLSSHSCTISRDKKLTYQINAAVNYETLTATTIDAETSIDVEPWSWDASLERQNFYNVMKESDSGRLPADPKNLSHVVWNDLLDKVHELSIATEATSSGWDVTYGTLDESYCYSGQNLTAQKYNALRQNVNRICSKVGIDSLLMEGISQVMIRDRIYGKHFILLANKINECIATGG